ncbi:MULTISPECIES: DUF397 domain-containing protein [Actinomadura]|uniref:DUF397 domain-containing protein n=1 Tax=Actinomadura yumaensis TaxID=111807 RepID=A0ABW2D176_9ACTN|nr:DUF397 domain-containing protein [Actinomadura sp. J1-007]MWK36438.1 DUF397 domain-containing protein [Actinomadura sp. J1-007]
MKMRDLAAAQWRKSSHSGPEGGECVEIADLLPLIVAHGSEGWRKSSHSGHQGGECVEVAGFAPVVAVRDSKDPEGAKLILGADAWRSLARRIKESEYDLA